jgi:hypothetical protein
VDQVSQNLQRLDLGLLVVSLQQQVVNLVEKKGLDHWLGVGAIDRSE